MPPKIKQKKPNDESDDSSSSDSGDESDTYAGNEVNIIALLAIDCAANKNTINFNLNMQKTIA